MRFVLNLPLSCVLVVRQRVLMKHARRFHHRYDEATSNLYQAGARIFVQGILFREEGVRRGHHPLTALIPTVFTGF